MKVESILKQYDAHVEIEVSEMTNEQIKELWKECEQAGLKFSRSEKRYESCIVHIFEMA